jgi:predicted metal-dependent hydrolase
MTQDTALIPWPPMYRIKKHRLARHVKLKTIDNHCLEIITPVRFNQKHIPKILEENKEWIIKHLAKSRPPTSDVLPDHIIFHALNQRWNIHYMDCQSPLEMIVRPTQELVFVGKAEDKQIYKRKLLHWIRNQARKYLIHELNLISQQTQIPFDTLTIRNQKTRWGSCSADKSISLNYKLIFLPPLLARHVMIHELCHTIYLNHSEQFWNKVAELDPAWRDHRRELRRADQYLPAWI